MCEHCVCVCACVCVCVQEMEGLLQEWMEFLKPVKNVKGKPYLDLLPSNDRAKVRFARKMAGLSTKHLVSCKFSFLCREGTCGTS